jgi:hypothetical protein
VIRRGAARLAKSSTASAAHTSEGTNLNQIEPQSGASQKIDAEHFCGFPTAKCEFQLYFYLCPRAQHSWQNTWVTSERIIHSFLPEKTGFPGVYPRKRERVIALHKSAKIVHASRNNTLRTQGLITR